MSVSILYEFSIFRAQGSHSIDLVKTAPEFSEVTSIPSFVIFTLRVPPAKDDKDANQDRAPVIKFP